MVHWIVRAVRGRGHSGKRWMRTTMTTMAFLLTQGGLASHNPSGLETWTLSLSLSLDGLRRARKIRDCACA